MTSNLRERALKGAGWTAAEYLINNVLRLVSNLILAYTLFPEAFALVAYASIVIQGLEMFSDIGIGPAIVQSRRGNDPDFLNTAWTFQIIRGLILFLVTLIVASPIADFYNEPMLAWIIPACGLNFIITGLQATAVHTCSRSLALRPLTIWGITETVAKAIITIIWAIYWPSVWAIVGGAFISYTIGMIMTHTMLPGIRNKLCWDRDAVKALIGFGGWVSISTMFTFVASQADRLMLGKLVAMGVVGVYSIALMFARLPYEVGARLAQAVLFPALADIARSKPIEFRAKFFSSRDPILAIAQLGTVGMIVVGPWFFKHVYDQRYIEAAFFAPWLAFAIWFSILQVSADRALLALGNSRALAASNLVNLVVTIVSCLVGFNIDHMRGFIVGLGIGNLAGYLMIVWFLRQHQLSIIKQDLAYTALVIFASSIGMMSAYWHSNSQIGSSAAWLLVFIGVGISAFAALLRLRGLLKERLKRFF